MDGDSPYVSLVEVEPVEADPACAPERTAELHRVATEVVTRLVPGSVLCGRLKGANAGRLFGLLTGPNRWTAPLNRAAQDVRCAAGYLAYHAGRLDRVDVDAREVDAREADETPPAVVGAMLAVHAARPIFDLLAAAVPPEERYG